VMVVPCGRKGLAGKKTAKQSTTCFWVKTRQADRARSFSLSADRNEML